MSPLDFDRRQYFKGAEDPRKYVQGAPQLGPRLDGKACPNCTGETLFAITVRLKDYPGIRTEYSSGNYVGCAACNYASPMMVVSGGKT